MTPETDLDRLMRALAWMEGALALLDTANERHASLLLDFAIEKLCATNGLDRIGGRGDLEGDLA